MKEKVLAALLAADGFLSGEKLCAELSVSRQAVWKAISQLRSEGYIIESRQNVGYRLTHAPDLLTSAEIAEHCELCGRKLFRYDSVDSTSTEAKRLSLSGESEAIIIADEQTGGRGRFGREFISPAGKGLYLSILTKPRIAPARLALLTACTAVAVCNAIESVCGVRPTVKWTNDLQFEGKKLCGILTEMTTEGESGRILSLVVGIGINVLHERADFARFADIATSIKLKTGVTVRRAALAGAVIREMDELFSALERVGTKAYIERYKKDCVTVGCELRVFSAAGERDAVAVGITDSAELVVRYEDGSTQALNSGEVSIKKR